MDGEKVLVAGDPERIHERKVLTDGVVYVRNQMESCQKLSNDLGVEMMKPMK